MTEQETVKLLFQKEFSKMVAVISKLYGLQHIEIAEDVVSQTFLLALETWQVKGLPANPTAWLYKIAKQKTLRHFRRNKILEEKVIPELKASGSYSEMPELDFSNQNIKDSQLQMLFAICNPAIASEAQIGLALRILCGFGIDEIADAFLATKEAINKRLFRAKEKLRTEKVKMELPPEAEIDNRLNNVLHVIYLLFNEGYYSKTQNQILRKELCLDALRLGMMLKACQQTDTPKTNALLALMCFHASRFSARQIGSELVILFEHQNQQLWDLALIKQGIQFLDASARGDQVSSYHIEARIACWHCMKEDTIAKWQGILNLYDQLLKINYSPGVALNRIYALFKVEGNDSAIIAAEKLQMENNHFYFILLGELYKDKNGTKAKLNFKKAQALAQTDTEKQILQVRIDSL